MDFRHTDDRRMLKDSFGRYLSDRYGFQVRDRISGSDEGFSGEIWGQLAELGVIGALFDETSGGFGGDAFDMNVVFEAVGGALVVEPLLGTLLAGRALAEAGDRQALLERVIAGSSIVTAGFYEAQGRFDVTNVTTRAERAGDSWVLQGGKAVVPHLDAADLVLVSARSGGNDDPDGLSLFLVPSDAPGVSRRGYKLIDGGRAGELKLEGVRLDASALVGTEGQAFAVIERAISAGIVALTAEAVGAMDVVKRDTLDYLRTRTQFGVPIGKFQAIQHRMATLLLEIEQARSAAINAAASLTAERRVREKAMSAAKFTVGRVGTLVAEEVIQIHGGIGMTWDLPLSHYAKRLTMINHQLGDDDYHLERFIELDAA